MLTTHTEHVQLWACFFSTHSRISSDESACVYYSLGIISSPIHMIPVICSFIPYQKKHMVSGDCCKLMGERIHFQMSPNSEARTVRSFQQHGTFFSAAWLTCAQQLEDCPCPRGNRWGLLGSPAKCSDEFGWKPRDLGLDWKSIRETPENPVIYIPLSISNYLRYLLHECWSFHME
jgi:hypothetical protein